MDLELRRRTRALGKDPLEVSDSLEQWLAILALGRRLLPAEPGPQPVQVPPQLSAQLIDGLQGKGQSCLLRRRFEREARQHRDQPLPQPTGSEGVAGENLGQEKAEAAATAATLATVAAPNPLATHAATIGSQRIVAVELAMAV